MKKIEENISKSNSLTIITLSVSTQQAMSVSFCLKNSSLFLIFCKFLFAVINPEPVQPLIKESLTENSAIPVTIKEVEIEKLNVR